MVLLHHGKSRYRAGKHLGPARWPHFDLLVVLQGGFIFTLSKHVCRAMAGDAILVPKNVQFHAKTAEHGGEIWIHHFRPGKYEDEQWLHQLPKHDLTYYHASTHGAWAQALLARIHDLHKNPAYKKEQTILFKLLLREIQDAVVASKGSVIQKALDETDEKQCKEVTIAFLAEQAGLSQSHFRARFAEEMGETVGGYLKRRRLQKARELLHSTDMPIKEISEEVGYSEIAAFYHAFKTAFGISPGKFRKLHSKVI